jgi:hypothetical protein
VLKHFAAFLAFLFSFSCTRRVWPFEACIWILVQCSVFDSRHLSLAMSDLCKGWEIHNNLKLAHSGSQGRGSGKREGGHNKMWLDEPPSWSEGELGVAVARLVHASP